MNNDEGGKQSDLAPSPGKKSSIQTKIMDCLLKPQA
jgi:hypothetical protein